jgi:hypothetical protein
VTRPISNIRDIPIPIFVTLKRPSSLHNSKHLKHGRERIM